MSDEALMVLDVYEEARSAHERLDLVGALVAESVLPPEYELALRRARRAAIGRLVEALVELDVAAAAREALGQEDGRW